MTITVALTAPALDANLIEHAVHAITTGLLSDSEVVDMLTDDVLRRSTLEVIAHGD